MIKPEKWADIEARMAYLGIQKEDLVEKFILGSGRGGQKVNKTASAVYLKHLPSGIEIKCQKDRSRQTNRFLARRQLVERLEKDQFNAKSPQDLKAEKIRKQKKRRLRRHLNMSTDENN